ERGAEHVVRGDVVGDVDQRRLGADPQRHALHRPRIVIVRAEVGQQRDDGASHSGSLLRGLGAGSWTDSGKPTAEAGERSYGSFRKRISRRLVCSRNESETRRPGKRRMMSRFSRIAWRPRVAVYGRCRRFTSSTMMNFV